MAAPDSVQETWEEAKRIAGMIGLAPNTIATCIRFLRKDVEEHQGELSVVSRYCLRTLLKGGHLRSALYYAARVYRPEKLAKNSSLTWDSFLSIFSTEELSFLIGMLFVFRRIKRGCSSSHFEQYCTLMHQLADIGAMVGDAIPRIGLGRGLLMGALRHLAGAMFLGIDEKNFLKYRRALRVEDRFFDCEAEMQRWHCTHAHIGSNIIQLLGYGVDEASTFAQACLPEVIPAAEAAEDVFRARITLTWIESFYASGAAPKIVHRGEYYPKAIDLERIIGRIATIRASGPSLWMTKNRDDLPPELQAVLAQERQQGDPPLAPEDISSDMARQIEDLAKEED